MAGRAVSASEPIRGVRKHEVRRGLSLLFLWRRLIFHLDHFRI
jgi:hypothetical protein